MAQSLEDFVKHSAPTAKWAEGSRAPVKAWVGFAKSGEASEQEQPEAQPDEGPAPWEDEQPETQPKANGHSGNGFDHSANGFAHNPKPRGGSESTNHSEAQAGKPYSDLNLRSDGYHLARVFDYALPDGATLYQELRYELPAGVAPTEDRPRKTSRFRHNVDGVDLFDTGPRRIIYGWPAILRAGPGVTVHITEGANKSEPLVKAGLLATAAAYHQWAPECVTALAGRHLIYHEDHDEKGREYSAAARAVLAPVAASFRVVPAAYLFRHLGKEPFATADVKDWLELGGDAAKLEEICRTIQDAKTCIEVRDIGNLRHRPPPRGFLMGVSFARKFLSQLFAAGAVGKTALRYCQYLALASGRPLTGEQVHVRSRVLILSFEDGIDELERRLWAAMLHHHVDQADIAGWIKYAALSRDAGKIMVLDGKGRLTKGDLADTIERLVVEGNIDLIGLDPFVKLHSVGENNNDAIDAVAQVLTDMSQKYDISVDAPHHVSKGPADPGNAQKGRGASALVDADRLAFTLTPMSDEEAKTFGVPIEERRSYVRLDKGKVNITPPARHARWFKLVGVAIGNGTETYPEGDNVQTVEVWVPPELWDGIDAELQNIILDEIDAGLPDGGRYSDAGAAKDRAAWTVVQRRVPDKSAGHARDIIKTWINAGVLERREYDDPASRKPAKGLFVNPQKRPS